MERHRMKWTSILLALVLSASLAQAAPSRPPARKADARQLLSLAETGLSGTVRAAHDTQGRLDPARPEQRPFWSALDKMDAALRRVRAGLATRDRSFFHAVEEGSAALGELRVVWARTGVIDPGVSQGLQILSGSYQLLRSGYGREAVRHRQGGGLTQEERQRFLRIQRTQERFAESLRVLEEHARQRGDEAMLAELRRMAEEAYRIAAARITLEAYLNALMIGDAQRGEWTGNSQYAPAEDRTEWLEAGAAVEELYVEEDVGQVVVVNLGNVAEIADLAYLDEPTELPETLADAVEAYVPSTVVLDDDVDPLEEEESLAEEEVVEETGTEGSDLAAYEDLEDDEEAVDPAADEVAGEDAEAPIEVEDLPVQEPKAAAPAATATPAQAAPPAPQVAPRKEPAPAPARKAPKQTSPSKKRADPPGLS
jgi:hypothetical protein